MSNIEIKLDNKAKKVVSSSTASGTKEITENGEYNIAEYANVNVTVESSSMPDVLQRVVDEGVFEYTPKSEEEYWSVTNGGGYFLEQILESEIKEVKIYADEDWCWNSTSTYRDTDGFCTNLTSLETAYIEGMKYVQAYGAYFFRNCSNLKTLSLPDFISFSNSAGAVYGLNSLETLYLGERSADEVTGIYITRIVEDCPNLKDVYLYLTTALPLLKSSGSYCFSEYTGLRVHVPSNLIETYPTLEGWSTLITNGNVILVAIEE